MHQVIAPGPLLFLWCSAPLMALLGLHLGCALVGESAALAIGFAGMSGLMLPPSIEIWLEDVQWIFLQMAMLPLRDFHYWLMPLVPLALLLGSTVLLVSLRETLGRCRVRSVQVFRVAAYVAQPALIVLFTATAGAEWLAQDLLYASPPAVEVNVQFGLLVGMPTLVLGSYLSVGLGRYLRLPRPWALGLAAALVGTLFALVVQAVLVALTASRW